MYYDIYPCDLTWNGECPKPHYCRDCATCKGWTETEADEKIYKEEAIEKSFEEEYSRKGE